MTLKLQPLEPEWLGEIASDDPADPRPFLLPGVRVEFAPIGRKAVRAAREAVRAVLGVDEADFITAADALSEELIRRGVTRWEGVGDEESDDAPVTPLNLDRFLADINRFEAADRVYVQPWAQRDAEGNASAGSPTGTSVQATPARDTASSLAKRSGTGGAGNARTASTSRRRKKAKPSGM